MRAECLPSASTSGFRMRVESGWCQVWPNGLTRHAVPFDSKSFQQFAYADIFLSFRTSRIVRHTVSSKQHQPTFAFAYVDIPLLWKTELLSPPARTVPSLLTINDFAYAVISIYIHERKIAAQEPKGNSSAGHITHLPSQQSLSKQSCLCFCLWFCVCRHKHLPFPMWQEVMA